MRPSPSRAPATMRRRFVKKSTERISPSPSRICPRANTPSPSARWKRCVSEPGERVFDVTSGDVSLATNFDIVAAAGGARKVCYITGAVEHEDDSIRGPLTVSFAASQGRREIQHVRGEKCLGRVGRCFQCFRIGGTFFGRGDAHPGNQRAADLARSVAAVAGARE